MSTFDTDLLRGIAPRWTQDAARAARQDAVIAAIGPVLQATLTALGIGTALRGAHFLAQVCEELFGFSSTEEADSGERYEGRRDLGNTEAGDGPRFKGRGLIQLTGRANYAFYSKPPRLDLIADPALAADPATSLRIACAYWTRRGLNTFADWDDGVTITWRINGGFNGIDTRLGYLATAKRALGIVAEAPASRCPELRPDATGPAVMSLQARLRRAGYPVEVDGEFGPESADILIRFQQENGLEADGVVGPLTWAALTAAPAYATA